MPKEPPILGYEDDRIKRYLNNEQTATPVSVFKQIKMYYAIGIVLNVLVLLLVSFALTETLDKNNSVPLNLIRMDGVVVYEAKDVRRDVLLRNVLQGLPNEE